MPVFTVDYQGREWTLNTDDIGTKELAEVERLTGVDGIGFMRLLAPTAWDGSPIRVPVLDGDGKVTQAGTPMDEIRWSVPSKAVTALWWLFQRHAGLDPGPIDQADVAYSSFLAALIVALAKSGGVEVTAEVDLPKAPTETSAPPPGPQDSTTEPTSPSFT